MMHGVKVDFEHKGFSPNFVEWKCERCNIELPKDGRKAEFLASTEYFNLVSKYFGGDKEIIVCPYCLTFIMAQTDS